MEQILSWFRKHLNNPQVVILVGLLVLGYLLLAFFGGRRLPFFAGLVIAYLLEGLVSPLVRYHVPRLLAVLIVLLAFMTGLFFFFFWLLPLLTGQITQLVQQLPVIITKTQELLLRLPEHYPALITKEQIVELTAFLRTEIFGLGQTMVSVSVASVLGLITIVIYLIIVPMLVFFFLKDKDRLLAWFASLLPRQRRLAGEVWRDVNVQIGKYIRGKTWEILIIWGVTYAAFLWLKLPYAMLLALFTGLSVLIPYIGVAVAVIPVALVAFAQWGLASPFFYTLGAYTVIQIVDGNILAPLLLSEAVDIHPVAIIAAILFFGGLWGFWGVFFAIPLATLVQAVLKAWPRQGEPPGEENKKPARPVPGKGGGGNPGTAPDGESGSF